MLPTEYRVIQHKANVSSFYKISQQTISKRNKMQLLETKHANYNQLQLKFLNVFDYVYHVTIL